MSMALGRTDDENGSAEATGYAATACRLLSVMPGEFTDRRARIAKAPGPVAAMKPATHRTLRRLSRQALSAVALRHR